MRQLLVQGSGTASPTAKPHKDAAYDTIEILYPNASDETNVCPQFFCYGDAAAGSSVTITVTNTSTATQLGQQTVTISSGLWYYEFNLGASNPVQVSAVNDLGNPAAPQSPIDLTTTECP